MRKGSSRRGLSLLVCIALTACGGSGSGSGDKPPDPGVTLTPTGGSGASNGVGIAAPSGVVADGQVTLSAALADAAPSGLPAEATQAGKVVTLTVDRAADLDLPVLVTAPYDPSRLDPDDVPMVFYWDAAGKAFWPAGVKSIDTTGNTVTFATVHAGTFVVMGIKGLAAQEAAAAQLRAADRARALEARATADSGFTPGVDGFFHPNFGAYDSPGGSCLGMANYSVWYYRVQKPTDQTGLYALYRQGDAARWEDDTTARELISRAFMASSQIWSVSWLQKDYKLGVRLTGLALITALKLSGPVTFLMADAWPGVRSGHATVVFKYDAGKFYVYDNNFPGEAATIDWGPDGTGTYHFSSYTKNAGYSPPFAQFAFIGMSDVAEPGRYRALYEGAKTGWSGADSKFNTIAITSAVDSHGNALTAGADGKYDLVSSDAVTLKGTVSGGLRPAKLVRWSVAGGAKRNAAIAADGSFTIALPTLTAAQSAVMLVATDDPADAWNAYAGFKEVTVRVRGHGFFVNAGFETGAFDGWTHETHTWDDPTPGSFTPEKSAIVGAGMDPIATTIPMVYSGHSSARVNNEDDSYHISSVTQSAVVPAVANPTIHFYWAAVLEDPSHDPANQPYVDVVVTEQDRTTQAVTTKYKAHFYSADPSYSGWMSFDEGEWKAINWQPITIAFDSASVGNTVTLTVLAADCGFGAHGGYLYLDGDE